LAGSARSVDFTTSKKGYGAGGNGVKLGRKPRQLLLATHDGGKTWREVWPALPDR